MTQNEQIANEGFWMVYDGLARINRAKPMTRRQARTKADRMDSDYGAYRYQIKRVVRIAGSWVPAPIGY